jgi:3-phenylpropionate/cinnamic acid dioxygenase small subunit
MRTLESDPNEAVGDEIREKQVRELLSRYVEVVDDRDLHAWVQLFGANSSYFVTTRENEERGLPIAFVYDDTKERIQDRVAYVEEVWHGHYNDYRQRHILSDASIEWMNGVASMRVSFAVYIAEQGRSGSQLLATGVYFDTVVFEDGQPKFGSKKVVVDSDVLPRYFVYPL